jgi:hypothetical protein
VPGEEPYQGGEREAYQGLVWQCHFSGIEVPDHLWKHAPIGLDRPYADHQADDMMSEPKRSPRSTHGSGASSST